MSDAEIHEQSKAIIIIIIITRRSLGLRSQVIMGTMEGNRNRRQDAGGSGGLIEYDILVPARQQWRPHTR